MKSGKVVLYESGNVMCSSIHGPQNIIFNATDGTPQTIETNFEIITHEKVISLQTYYGIVGLVDLKFSKHLIIINDCEMAAESDNSSLSVWKITAIKTIPVYRRPIALSLDEEEFESVSLRDIETSLSLGYTYFSHDIDLTNGLQFMAKEGS